MVRHVGKGGRRTVHPSLLQLLLVQLDVCDLCEEAVGKWQGQCLLLLERLGSGASGEIWDVEMSDIRGDE